MNLSNKGFWAEWIAAVMDKLTMYRHQKKMSSSQKNRSVKGTCGRGLSELFMNSLGLWTVAPLPFSMVQLSFLPSFRVWISILYTRLQFVREGVGVRQINTCRKVPLQVIFYFFFQCLLWVVSFYGGGDDVDIMLNLSARGFWVEWMPAVTVLVKCWICPLGGSVWSGWQQWPCWSVESPRSLPSPSPPLTARWVA
jgi:hypothetical protein